MHFSADATGEPMTLCNENAPILVNEEMGCNIWLMTVRAP